MRLEAFIVDAHGEDGPWPEHPDEVVFELRFGPDSELRLSKRSAITHVKSDGDAFLEHCFCAMELPSFDSSAISHLTQRIQSNLASSNSAEPRKKRQPARKPETKISGPGGQISSGTKRLLGGKSKDSGDVQSSKENGTQSASRGSVPRVEARPPGKVRLKPVPRSRPHAEAHPSGKTAPPKSQALATPRPAGSAKKQHEKGTTLKNPARQTSSKPEGTDLEEDIRALGGTEEDLALIDIDSESEVEGADAPATGLHTELQRFASQLGLNGIAPLTESDTSSQVESVSNPNEIVLQPREPRTPRPGNNGGGSSRFIFEPASEWHAVELHAINLDAIDGPLAPETTERLLGYAKELLEEENATYAQHVGSSTAHQFYSTIMTSGTLSDKISALTLSVQESPVHNVRALDSLVALAKKRSRAQAVDVLGALKDLFGQGSLLPSDRKLRPFAAQPGLRAAVSSIRQPWQSSQRLPAPLAQAHLVAWAFEDWLKVTYFAVLKILETWCNDEIVFARGRAVEYVYELLKEKPEQEANLLRLLVNKLGDSDKKIASKASHNLLQLELSHPLMKPTIISSVESDLLFRPGQSLDAQYYAVITLNQTVLSGREEPVARKVLDIYFTLFLQLLAQPREQAGLPPKATAVIFNRKGQVQGGGSKPGAKSLSKLAKSQTPAVREETRDKILSAVLTGVNRALPYTQVEDGYFDQHLDTLFRVTHSSNFNTSIQALMLIQQLCGSHQAASDRFYRTLYESLLDARLLTTSKHALYLNLLFRALRADLKVKRVKAFAKRLVQIASMHQPSLTCGILYLLRELEGIFPDLTALYHQAEEDDSDEVFHDVDADPSIVAERHAAALQEYDGRKRDPEFSRAERSCLWELEPLLTHFHPSVALFARTLLHHEGMPPKPDLSSNTLRHFLDRFVYRNPKKAGHTIRGSSIMQPLASGDASHLLLSAGGRHTTNAPVNSQSFWQMDGGKVAADEVFFHKYFHAIGKGKEKLATKKHRKDENEDEEDIWKALVDSKPELEADSDPDLAMSDLESAFEDTDEEAERATHESDDLDFDEDPDLDEDDAELESEEELPSDLDQVFGLQEQPADGRGEMAKGTAERKAKRRKLKSLPTFASVEDYAAMLGDDPE